MLKTYCITDVSPISIDRVSKRLKRSSRFYHSSFKTELHTHPLHEVGNNDTSICVFKYRHWKYFSMVFYSKITNTATNLLILPFLILLLQAYYFEFFAKVTIINQLQTFNDDLFYKKNYKTKFSAYKKNMIHAMVSFRYSKNIKSNFYQFPDK